MKKMNFLDILLLLLLGKHEWPILVSLVFQFSVKKVGSGELSGLMLDLGLLLMICWCVFSYF